jgi:C1A family cysteine protease
MQEDEIKLGGWLQDAADPRDVPIDALLSSSSAVQDDDVDLRKWCPPVENQRELGSCVANATVGALELRRMYGGMPHVDLSRLFVYFNARLAHQATNIDDGTYIRIALQSLSKMGVCPEDLCPYDTSKVFIRPSWKAYRKAYAYKIDKYYRIASKGEARIDDVLAALSCHHPVIFGAKVWKYFKKISADGEVPMPHLNDALEGTHAMLIVGCKKSERKLIVRNSWGPSWGDGGYCYMRYDYLDVSDADDFWTFTC